MFGYSTCACSPYSSIRFSRSAGSHAPLSASANVRGYDGGVSFHPAAAHLAAPERRLSPTCHTSAPSDSRTTLGTMSPNFDGRREVHRSDGSVTCVSTSMIGMVSSSIVVMRLPLWSGNETVGDASEGGQLT